LSAVLLPAPFGPITLVIAPDFASKVRSLTARTPPKFTDRPLTDSAGGSPRRRNSATSWVVRADRSSAFAAKRRPSNPTNPTGAGGGERGGGRADQDRVEADRLARRFRIAQRPHGTAPRARAQQRIERNRHDGAGEHQIGRVALGELGTEQGRRRNSGKAVPS